MAAQQAGTFYFLSFLLHCRDNTLVITAVCALEVVDYKAVKYECVFCLIQRKILGNMSCRSRSVKVNTCGLTTARECKSRSTWFVEIHALQKV